MTQYTPDRWVVITFDTDGVSIDKVLAGWYGGYVSGDSWKLSSGVSKVTEFSDRYEFDNVSGSVYVCYKCCMGFSAYTRSTYVGFELALKETTTSITINNKYD